MKILVPKKQKLGAASAVRLRFYLYCIVFIALRLLHILKKIQLFQSDFHP